VGPLLTGLHTLAVVRAVLAAAAAALGLLSSLAERAGGGVDAGETLLADADLAGVGQADGRALPDVAVGAPPAVEALTAGDVRDAVRAARELVTDGAGTTDHVGAALAHADLAGLLHALVVGRTALGAGAGVGGGDLLEGGEQLVAGLGCQR